jgi:hypothetical protein
MYCAVEMGSDSMIYVPSFIKIGSGIQKLMEAGEEAIFRHTQIRVYRQHGERVSCL